MYRNRILSLGLILLLALFLAAYTRSASSPNPPSGFSSEDLGPGLSAVPFPLAADSTWVYEYRNYDGDKRAVWIVTETILSTEAYQGMWVAEVERRVFLQEGQPDDEFLRAPTSEGFWYILRDSHLFSQSGSLNIETLDTHAYLILIFPAEEISCWPLTYAPSPLQRGTPGCRYVSQSLPFYETPAGIFENCLELITPFLGGGILAVFCPDIGIVYEKFDHAGSPYGYELILTAYSLQTP